MTQERSYADLADSATTFDPELQFDKDIDERNLNAPASRNSDLQRTSSVPVLLHPNLGL